MALSSAGKQDSVIVAWENWVTGTAVPVWAIEPSMAVALKTWSLPAGYELVRAENLVGEKLELETNAPVPLSSSPIYLFCRRRAL